MKRLAAALRLLAADTSRGGVFATHLPHRAALRTLHADGISPPRLTPVRTRHSYPFGRDRADRARP
jgi:hypothetical protein